MLKILFVGLLALHGVIHFLGFFKAFELADIEQLTKSISKAAGSLWLIAGLLLLITAGLFLIKEESWYWCGIPAILISQILIISAWDDAQFGTIANVLILLAAIIAIGNDAFYTDTVRESESIMIVSTNQNPDSRDIRSDTLLPDIVRKWMRRSGVNKAERHFFGHVTQKGEMRTKKDAKWMKFRASQVFNLTEPAFVWETKVTMGPLLFLTGRDKLKDGKGRMIIKFLSLFNLVNEGPNEKIDQGALIRYLGEMCWFPETALSPLIKWEAMDSNTAKATIHQTGNTVSGVFSFSEEGDIIQFIAQRYFGGDKDAKLETWVIEPLDYRTFDGVRIPYKNKVTWRLDEGDFHWLTLEVTALKKSSSPFDL